MRHFLLFILPIVTIVVGGFILFGLFQNQFQQDRETDNLIRRVKAIAESTELAAQHIILNRDSATASRLVESFQKRERMQGCILYNKNAEIIAVTERVSKWVKKERPVIFEIISTGVPTGNFGNYDNYYAYNYSLPVLDDHGNLIGLIEVLYDATSILSLQSDLWKRMSIFLIVLTCLLAVITLLLQRQIFFLPLKQLTNWFHLFQKGNIDTAHPITGKGMFSLLANEVEQVALNLRVARKAVSQDAASNLANADLWTESKLRNLVQARLGANGLYVISNREPYMHIHDPLLGQTKCVRPAGGVVTAIHPILSACGGTWIAHGSGNEDKKFVNSKDKLGVPPNDIRYILKRLWLSKVEEEGYYYGFSNEGLWPLCHNTHTRPVFREHDWAEYKKVNMKFAEAVLEELPDKNPFIFIQDYHFTLLAKYIKEKRPDATIALFWHIPWPNPEAFSICPYQAEILEGLLGCDLIGFHVQNHCNNFLDTANRLLESRVDTERYSVMRFGRETLIRPFPISIDSIENSKEYSFEIISQISKIKKEFDLEGKTVAVGVDRIDYTKGIVERFLAVERLLEKFPEYKTRFTLIQIGSPSRTHIKRYHELISEIDELVERINWKYQDENWKPILYFKRHFSPEEIEPYYALADMCIVSSLHDGMNLVAKEYVHAKKDLNGVLLLSQFTGAAKELTEAVLINPYSIEEFAGSLRTAIEMPEEEKKKRMSNMRNIITENNVYRWAANIITELTNIKKP